MLFSESAGENSSLGASRFGPVFEAAERQARVQAAQAAALASTQAATRGQLGQSGQLSDGILRQGYEPAAVGSSRGDCDEAAAAVVDERLSTLSSISKQVRRIAGTKTSVAFLLVILSLVCLVGTQPPFVLRVEYDRRRPWWTRSSLCWISTLVVTLFTLICFFAFPVLLGWTPEKSSTDEA